MTKTRTYISDHGYWASDIGDLIKFINNLITIEVVAVGGDRSIERINLGETEVTLAPQGEFEWIIYRLDDFFMRCVPLQNLSWLTIHCFSTLPLSVPLNLSEDFQLFNESKYRQNFSAVAEVYVWDSDSVLVVFDRVDDLPLSVGRLVSREKD